MTDDIMETIETQRELVSPIVLECLREIFHHIPKGQKFILSNGKMASFKTFRAPGIHGNTGRCGFGLDVIIDDFSVRHIEFTMEHTGQGGPPLNSLEIPCS